MALERNGLQRVKVKENGSAWGWRIEERIKRRTVIKLSENDD